MYRVIVLLYLAAACTSGVLAEVSIEVQEFKTCGYKDDMNTKVSMTYDAEKKVVNGGFELPFDADDKVTYDMTLKKLVGEEWKEINKQEKVVACKAIAKFSPTGKTAFLENIGSPEKEVCSVKKGSYKFTDFGMSPEDISTTIPGEFKGDLMINKEGAQLACFQFHVKMTA